jgi:hypothetical protein
MLRSVSSAASSALACIAGLETRGDGGTRPLAADVAMIRHASASHESDLVAQAMGAFPNTRLHGIEVKNLEAAGELWAVSVSEEHRHQRARHDDRILVLPASFL